MPPPLSSPVAPKRHASPSRRQGSSSFPQPARSHAHRCSRLTRQHGGEQSGLVILTFDLLTLKVVSELCDVGYLCANFGLPRPMCSRLRPDPRDMSSDARPTSDVRQHHRWMPPPKGRRHINHHNDYESQQSSCRCTKSVITVLPPGELRWHIGRFIASWQRASSQLLTNIHFCLQKPIESSFRTLLLRFVANWLS